MYTFVKVQCHPKIPSLTGWYLKISKGDMISYSDFQLSMVAKIARQKIDPHIKTEKIPSWWMKLFSPLAQSKKWTEVTSFYICKHDLLFNKDGGWMFFNPKYLLETCTSDILKFPEETYKHEIITIKKWPQGKHWYLTSSVERIFVPEKHNTIKEARELAEQYVDPDHIRVDDTKFLGTE
jgi:hypothetical protein